MSSLTALLVLSSSLMAQTSYRTNPDRTLTYPFDTPIRTSIVDLGPSPYYPGLKPPHIRLSCFVFSQFVVKEYDEGQKGAEWLAIVPLTTQDHGQCAQSHVAGERVIDGGEWCGYFKGVKRNFVFFNACDGTNGGLPFAVYDSRTGKKVFEDSAYDWSRWGQKAEDSPFSRLRISKVQAGPLLLKYLRVVEAECDLHIEKASCWDRLRVKLDLRSTKIPFCSGYQNISGEAVSMVAYPVSVYLAFPPVVKTIAGPVRCWAPD